MGSTGPFFCSPSAVGLSMSGCESVRLQHRSVEQPKEVLACLSLTPEGLLPGLPEHLDRSPCRRSWPCQRVNEPIICPCLQQPQRISNTRLVGVKRNNRPMTVAIGLSVLENSLLSLSPFRGPGVKKDLGRLLDLSRGDR